MRAVPTYMEVAGMRIGVHHPGKQTERRKDPRYAKELASPCPWPVHRVSDYANAELPRQWVRHGGPSMGSFFIGGSSSREAWFHFGELLKLPREVAILVSVQGVNALSVVPLEETTQLEQYSDTCPKHATPLDDRRYCAHAECRRTWPFQNYIALNEQPSKPWIDGYRTTDDLIHQFVFVATESGQGIAQQLIGKARPHEIGFAVFLSRELKPVPKGPIYRGMGPALESLGGSDDELQMHSFGGDFECLESSVPVSKGMPHSLVVPGSATRGAPVSRQAISTELSTGRAVDQDFARDPHPLTYWQSEPAAAFFLNHADQAFVEQLTRNGPTLDRDNGGMGPLAGLATAGE